MTIYSKGEFHTTDVVPPSETECGVFTTFRCALLRNKTGCVETIARGLPLHVRRLREGLRWLGVADNHAIPENLSAIAEHIMERDGLSDARVRITCIACSTGIAVSVTAEPTGPEPRAVILDVASTPRTTDERWHFKLTARTDMNRELADAREHGFFDRVFLDKDGHVLETSIGNLFFVRGNQLVTPPTSLPLLPGIARAGLLELDERNGLHIREGLVAFSELSDFDACLFTNSVRGVLPVAQVGDCQFDERLATNIAKRPEIRAIVARAMTP